MIYPTPNPTFPWLGVHLTRSIDGHIHAGPNAVLAFSREGYEKTDFNLGDAWETLTFPGFWKFSLKHYQEGLKEVYRSFSKELFLKSLQRLVPNIQSRDLVPSPAGVRAMALTPAGGLVDDFAIIEDNRSVHVLNAPSPAATASLAIASVIVEKVERQSDFQKNLVIGVGDESFGNRN
jgi:L-2-hydroxyglutarate oxidase